MAYKILSFFLVLSIVGSTFTLLGQQDITYTTKEMSVVKMATVDPSLFEPGFAAKVVNLEAPSPGGDSYRSYLLEVKKEVRKRFPTKTNESKEGADNSLPAPFIQQEFALKTYIDVIDYLDYFKDSGVPLDNTLAISNDDFLICGINSKIYMHDLKTGIDPKTADISSINFESFASNAGITTSSPFDPKIVYDPEQDRFVMTFLTGRTPSNSGLVLAFSTSNDPRDPWNVYLLSGNPFDNGLWSDYPAIALSKNELFYTINLLVPGSDWKTSFSETIIWQIDKFNGYTGADSLSLKIWGDIKLDGRNLRNLAVVPGGSELKGPNMFFLSNRNFDVQNDTTFLVEITNSLDKTAVLNITPLIADQAYGVPPNGRQQNSNPSDPDDGFDTNDARVLGAFLENDEIQFVGNSVNPSTGLAAIYHGIISGPSNQPSIRATILASNDLDYGYPNIAFTGGNSCNTSSLIGFDHTSPTVYAGISAIRYSRESDGNDMYSTPLILKSGENYVDRHAGTYERWGDYFGIQRKYNEPGIVYTAGFYGTENSSVAGTWMSKIRDCDCFRTTVIEDPNSSTNACVGNLVAQTENGIDPITFLWNNSDSVYSIPVNLCDYSFFLTVSDKYNCSTYFSDSIKKSVPKSTNSIYPNPTSDDLNVYFETSEKTAVSVYIFSADGRLAFQLLDNQTTSEGKNLLSFSTAPLGSGLYVIKVQDGDDIILSKKLVIE